MRVLIIIPAFNEEQNLPKLFAALRSNNPEYDIVVVNDCSRDNTAQVCRENNVRVLDLPVNLGIGGAVQAGYRYACYNNYDIAVQVDGDGQHDPRYIGLLVDQVKNGVNLSIGSRFIERKGFQSTFLRRLGIKYLSGLIRLVTNRTVTDPTSGFRACGRTVIEMFSREYPMDYPEPETVVYVLRNNLSISELPVEMNERENGVSSINWLKSIYYMIKVGIAIFITSISSKHGGKS